MTMSGYMGDTRMLICGDADGDGTDDLVAGYSDIYSGVVVYPGGSHLATTSYLGLDSDSRSIWIEGSTSRYDYFGRYVALADLDGDGQLDVVASATGAATSVSSGNGAIFGFLGPITTHSDVSGADVIIEGAEDMWGFGESFVTGDFDDDGDDDVVACDYPPCSDLIVANGDPLIGGTVTTRAISLSTDLGLGDSTPSALDWFTFSDAPVSTVSLWTGPSSSGTDTIVSLFGIDSTGDWTPEASTTLTGSYDPLVSNAPGGLAVNTGTGTLFQVVPDGSGGLDVVETSFVLPSTTGYDFFGATLAP